jgi:hypothetical protein
MFYSTARSIDNQATATTFRAAYVRYASEAEAWFDGTPQSIDGRIARANRLTHLAKESVARQGMDADKLASIAELQADVKALTALRHDLLTAGADREDTSPIAGVHIAAVCTCSGPTHAEADPDCPRHRALGNPKFTNDKPRSRDRKANCGDDEEYKGGEHDEDGEQPNDYLFDEQGRYRRERFKGKEGYRTAGSEWRSIECPECGSKPGDNCTEGSGNWADEGRFDHAPHELRTDPDVIAEYLEEFSPENVQHGEDQRNEGLRELADAIVRGGPREAGLSPDDRRFVVLESAKFLADNADTDDVRELATRAQHFAQRVTSAYSAGRSQAVTTAFVRRVASAATQRREADLKLRKLLQPLLEGISYGTEGMEDLPAHGPGQALAQGLARGLHEAVPPSGKGIIDPGDATLREMAEPLVRGIGQGLSRRASVNELPPEMMFL